LTCTTSSFCTECDSGFYLTASNSCASCSQGCISCDSLGCIQCSVGLTLNFMKLCICPTGQFYDTATSLCSPCNVIAGCTECSSSTVCTVCQAGYYVAMNACTLCSSSILNCL
jgi:hypothetical protein